MRLPAINQLCRFSVPLLLVPLLFAVGAVRPVSAYAPNVGGRVFTESGAPVPGVWVQWESNEEGNDNNEVNKGTHYRYSGTTEAGRFFFKGWDLDGTRRENGQVYSIYGQSEFDERIDLNYDPADGKEARRASSNQYNIFNCNNEVNNFSLKLPPSLQNARVDARWRRDNSAGWSSWTPNRVSMPKDIFNNSHDYEVEFRIRLPKQSSIRDMERDIEKNTISDVNTLQPACLKADLCTAEGKNCSSGYTPTAGKHRVILSQIGGSGIGEAQRKLTVGDQTRPIWLTECIQTGTATAPSYTCTTGNSQLDLKIFKKDNASLLYTRYGYSARIFFSDGVTQTTPEITQANRRDSYEWETTIDPDKVQPAQLTSVFIAMWDPGQSSPPSSGDRPTQLQATLSNAERCKLIIDPYGRVFDTLTLEPLAGATVVLTRQRPGGAFTPVVQSDVVGTIQNPQTTSRDGSFSFLVPPGTYRLSASRQGYIYPATNISPLARQMYSNLYTGQDLRVVDTMIQTDIPLEPLNPGEAIAYAQNNPIRIQSYFQIVDPAAGTYRIEGSVTHPLATVNLYTGVENRKLLHTATADSFGYFKITLRLDAMDKNIRITELEARKKDVPAFKYTGDEYIVQLAPVLGDLEGFAVGSGGTLLGNAEVGIYMGSSNVPVFRTRADADGRFTVPQAALPVLPYQIGFTPSGGRTEQVSTGEFLARNAMLSHPKNVYIARGSDSTTVLGEYSQSRPGINDALGAELNRRTPFSILGAIMAVAVVVIATGLIVVYFRSGNPPVRRRR